MKNIFKGLGLGVLALVLSFGLGVGSASANLTISALTIDSSAALNLGTATATSLSLGATGVTTTNNGALTVTQTLTGNGSVVLGDAAADLVTVGGTIQGASPLVFEGLTADANEMTFAIPDAGDATITFPSVTGTLATLAGTETLTGKTFTAPKFADLGFIADASGAAILAFDSTTTPVNYFQISNAPTATNLSLSAIGTDTNISISYNTKGSGVHRFQEQSATGDVIAIAPQTAGAGSFTGTITSADLTGNKTYTFPNATGAILLEGQAIGGVTPAAGTFTSVTATTSLRAPTSAETLVDGADAGTSCAAGNSGALVIDAANKFYGCDGINWQVLD
jgi:hypothetical protein